MGLIGKRVAKKKSVGLALAGEPIVLVPMTPVTPQVGKKRVGRPSKKKQQQQDRDTRREASFLESASITDSPRTGSRIAPSGLALLSPASVSSVASSFRSSNRSKKGEFVILIIIIIKIIRQESCCVWPVMN
jgi:hypothetical protein